MNIEVEKRELQRQIDALLAKPSMTATERKQVDVLLSKVANLRGTEERKARLAAAMADAGLPMNDEQRSERIERAFNKYVRTGDESEVRTYSALSTAGVPIPQNFLASYVEKLKSFSGIREVANVITTATGQSLKNPYTDDTASVGERLQESDPVSLSNPTFNSTNFVAYRYSSKGLKYSAQLLQDAGIDVTAYLQNIFAKRIGRITNSEFTNGGIGAMAGVIPSITAVQTSAAPTAVSVSEIISLQALDAGYLDGAVYMFSPGVERALKALTTANGEAVFEEMRTGRVLAGYPYVLNVDMSASLAANAKAIVFGNFKHGVTIREVFPSLLVSSERFIEQNLLYASLRHDQDCQTVDPSALAVLQMHA